MIGPYPDINIFAGGYVNQVTIEIWLMEQIGALEVATAAGIMAVKDFLPEIREEVTVDTSGQYALLSYSMKSSGQVIPLLISKDSKRLRDGIHRIAIAELLGWKSMTVSDTKITYDQWDHTDAGREYHRRWQDRIGYHKNETRIQL